jgi:hypothetical protein
MAKGKDRTLELLKYALAADYHLEHVEAAFIASKAFEAILKSVEEAADREQKGFQKRLVERYCRVNKRPPSCKDTLETCIRLRNEIVHDQLVGGQLDHATVEQLLENLCEVLGQDYENLRASQDHEALRRYREEFGDRPHDESYAFPMFGRFEPEDFRNLYSMRVKLLCLCERMKQDAGLQGMGLHFDHLSRVDSTSGYVWAAAVRDRKGARSKVRQPSLSILATPQDLRLYLDFGGDCKRERLRYLQLLAEGKLDDHLGRLGAGYEFFDVFWYCSIVQDGRREVRDALTNPGAFRQQAARRIQGFKARNREALLPNSERTLTENVLLVGKIFDQAAAIDLPDVTREAVTVFQDLAPILDAVSDGKPPRG